MEAGSAFSSATRCASDATYAERAHPIYQFVRRWNKTARPSRWTFKGYPLHR